VCLGMAMAAFTGQNMGAGNIARIHQAYRKCVMLALGWSAAILLAVFVGREFLVRMFVDDVTVIELGKKQSA
ncbi:MAG: MATE family efflux transporter, partial [Clostridia bacterium]|nr:MATE family efflux transporter [Clostridia bacterium]